MSSGPVEDECSPVVLDQNTTLSVKKKDSQTDEEIKLEKLEWATFIKSWSHSGTKEHGRISDKHKNTSL